MKIFGRDPSVAIGVLETLVLLLATFNLPGLSDLQAAALVAVIVAVGGALQAWTTRDTFLAALLGVVKALAGIGAVYGLAVSEQQLGLIVSLVSIVAGAYLRTQTSAVETPVSEPSPGTLALLEPAFEDVGAIDLDDDAVDDLPSFTVDDGRADARG